MTRQRASCSATTCATVSRISWSSAPRLAGFEILILTTPALGSSRRTFPDASSVEDNESVTFRHGLALFALDLLHGAVVLGLDGHLHLHRLEDHERVAFLDLLAHLDLDFPDGSGDVGFDVRQFCSSVWVPTGMHDKRRVGPGVGRWQLAG